MCERGRGAGAHLYAAQMTLSPAMVAYATWHTTVRLVKRTTSLRHTNNGAGRGRGWRGRRGQGAEARVGWGRRGVGGWGRRPAAGAPPNGPHALPRLPSCGWLLPRRARAAVHARPLPAARVLQASLQPRCQPAPVLPHRQPGACRHAFPAAQAALQPSNPAALPFSVACCMLCPRPNQPPCRPRCQPSRRQHAGTATSHPAGKRARVVTGCCSNPPSG